MSGQTVGQKAREMRRRVVECKSSQLFTQFIEPAVYQAAEQGRSFCHLMLEGAENEWLLNASGTHSVFIDLVERNGLHVHSFEKGVVQNSSVFFIVLSWEDEEAQPPPMANHPAPPPQAKPDTPAPLPRNQPPQSKPQPEPRPAQLDSSGTELCPAVRPFIGMCVQYPPTLHSICKTGDLNGLLQLLQFETEVDAPDSFGYTALHHAVSSGFADHAQLLIDHGANVLAGGMKKLTPLHCAAHMGRVDLVRLLAPIANVNKLDNTAKTPLHWAAERGYSLVTQELLAHGARVNIDDQYGMTPLKYAMFWQFDGIIGMLRERTKAEEEEEDEEEEEEAECFLPVREGELAEEGLLEFDDKEKGKETHELDDVE